MDRVHLAANSPVNDLRGVGIGVYKDAAHIGVLCREWTTGTVQLLHLAFHEDLRESSDTSKCVLWVEARLEQEQATIVAAQARLIYRLHGAGGIPYGFSPHSGYFGAKGEIRWSTPGRGLTCSTFVLAVFDRAGVQLVKGETWPNDRDEDRRFQRKMIDEMRLRTRAPAAHLKGMKEDVGQVRFRPIEVAGAVAADSYPSDFPTTESLGKQLLLLMIGSQGPDSPSSSAPPVTPNP